MRLTKSLPILGVGLALTFGLAACSPAAEPAPPADPAPVVTETPAEETPSEETPAKPAPSGANTITFTALGEKGADGEYAHFDVEIAVSVDSVDLISDAERAEIYSVANDSDKATFDAFDFYKILFTQTYVSGQSPEFQSSITSFDPIDAAGTRLQSLPLIGFDWCKSNSFSRDFVNGEANTSCVLAAVAKGAAAPAGLQFSQFDTPSESNPVLIFKK